ncbi:lipoyl(octanoyl) transferase LipB [Candidatus Leptofilum sp.]|uniref:lipoyl(octanoyl) transferase LipB n=1 Tax=Candidatus Leptofilum sp. TaxID=3241576 RepID=UPI003B5C456B
MRTIDVQWVGRVDYLAAWEQQKELVAERIANPEVAGKLLLLEHPHTYTLGRNGRLNNLLLNETELAKQGIAFYQVDRGGDITYHGPGQLVGYPILSLKQVYAQPGLGVVRRYITDLEEVLIQTVAQFGIAAQRLEGQRGVWVETPNGIDKLAAIGVRIQKNGVTSHGFALNVNPDLTYFNHIIPCGIEDHGVVSMAELLPQPITIFDILPRLISAFSTVFQLQANEGETWLAYH